MVTCDRSPGSNTSSYQNPTRDLSKNKNTPALPKKGRGVMNSVIGGKLARLDRLTASEETALFPEDQCLCRNEDRTVSSDHHTGKQDQQEVT